MMEERLQRVVASVLGISAADIDGETSMETVPAWDSLRHMNLMLALEEAFSLKLGAEDFEELVSWEAIREYVVKNGKGEGS